MAARRNLACGLAVGGWVGRLASARGRAERGGWKGEEPIDKVDSG